MWRSAASVNLMLPKEERKAMLLRLFNDDSELIDHSQIIKGPQPAAATNGAPARRNSSSSEAPEPVAADGAEGMKIITGDEVDEEEGGVSLNGFMDVDAPEPVEKMPTEEDYLQAEDMVLGEKQNNKDQLEQTAPEVTDEA